MQPVNIQIVATPLKTSFPLHWPLQVWLAIWGQRAESKTILWLIFILRLTKAQLLWNKGWLVLGLLLNRCSPPPLLSIHHIVYRYAAKAHQTWLSNAAQTKTWTTNGIKECLMPKSYPLPTDCIHFQIYFVIDINKGSDSKEKSQLLLRCMDALWYVLREIYTCAYM